jgi:hypothetical protein
MSLAIRRRVEHLEKQAGLEQDQPLVVLVDPGESIEEAIERCCEGWGLPQEAFSMRMVLDLYGSSRGP